ncbi:hypothetical protein NDU88_001985 [Pleurodeles waltl]|uniref:Uncharacterized protein n=1 Tax=Pleurodeles waltl TaxID=8319 RepID=A0AAV7TLX8_PLEWA|nr:hypothetical protein NDU88_001985 [Pleurodeles waltl]
MSWSPLNVSVQDSSQTTNYHNSFLQKSWLLAPVNGRTQCFRLIASSDSTSRGLPHHTARSRLRFPLLPFGGLIAFTDAIFTAVANICETPPARPWVEVAERTERSEEAEQGAQNAAGRSHRTQPQDFTVDSPPAHSLQPPCPRCRAVHGRRRKR